MANLGMLHYVIPAKAGIQKPTSIYHVYTEDLYDELIRQLDSSLRWNDMVWSVHDDRLDIPDTVGEFSLDRF